MLITDLTKKLDALVFNVVFTLVRHILVACILYTRFEKSSNKITDMYGKVNVLYPRYDKLKSETISHFGG